MRLIQGPRQAAGDRRRRGFDVSQPGFGSAMGKLCDLDHDT